MQKKHSLNNNININNRNYGIDLLRVYSMFLIVLLHVLAKSDALKTNNIFSINYQLAWLLEIAALCASNCYALISGYVGINAKHKYSNIIYLHLQSVFYSVCITLPAMLIFDGQIEIRQILSILFPFTSKTYWYFTAYFCLFFFVPALNAILYTLDKSCLDKLVLSVIIFFSVLPTLMQFDIFGTSNGYSVWWIMILYIIGGYIKKYNLWNNVSLKILLRMYVVLILVVWIIKFVIEFVTGVGFVEPLYGISYVSPLILMISVCMLVVFSRLNLNNIFKKFTCFFAPATFGVYLIHCEPFIYNQLSKIQSIKIAEFSPLIMLSLILSITFIIWFVCSIIDKLRAFLFVFLQQNLHSAINYILSSKLKFYLTKVRLFDIISRHLS